jgi:uncharacterized protein YjbI with pentapeptide repeats
MPILLIHNFQNTEFIDTNLTGVTLNDRYNKCSFSGAYIEKKGLFFTRKQDYLESIKQKK